MRPFKDLTHLTLHVDEPSPWSSLLTPTLLPALVDLSVSSSCGVFDELPIGHPHSFEKVLARIAPQLVHFTSSGRSFLTEICTEARVWARLTALKHLAIVAQDIHKVLKQLSGQLETLRIICWEDPDYQPILEMDALLKMMERDVPSIAELKKLTVAVGSPWPEEEEVFDEVVCELGEACEGRGIELRLEDLEGEGDD